MTGDTMTWTHPDDVEGSTVGEGITLRERWSHPSGAEALVVDPQA